MKKKILFTVFIVVACAQVFGQQTSGNPVLKGWYADPEATIFGNE